jgi:hypothetical protein
MRFSKKTLTAILGAFVLLPGVANAASNPEHGWWFYQSPPPKPAKPRTKKPVLPVTSTAPNPASAPAVSARPPAHPCHHAATWTTACGFVNPGHNFAFQAKERDALMDAMVMNPENPQAVLQFQKYNQWLVNEAVQVANMWYFNEIQHPGLNPQSTNPISTFGLQLAENVKRNTEDEIFGYLSKHAILIDFSRQSCYYCHAMVPNDMAISRDTKIPIYDASLSTTGCLPGFDQAQCLTAPATIKPAEILHVRIVPTLFLFVKPDTWIRVGTGVVDQATLESRIVDFVSAYRTAILHGIHNGNGVAPSVDFNPADSDGFAKVGDGKGVRPENGPLPTSSDIESLMETGNLRH